MPSKLWDSPFQKGYQDFPGETSGPGTYNDNPALGPGTTGGFEMKFYEKIEGGNATPIESPIENMKAKQSVNPAEMPSEAPKPSFSIESPFKNKFDMKR